jgi:hypothetical protein
MIFLLIHSKKYIHNLAKMNNLNENENEKQQTKGQGGRIAAVDQKDEDYSGFSQKDRTKRFQAWIKRTTNTRDWPDKYALPENKNKLQYFMKLVRDGLELPEDLTEADKLVLERLSCEYGEKYEGCIIYRGACPTVNGLQKKDGQTFKIPFGRLAYLLQADKPIIPKGCCVFRTCGNTRCLRKEHLYINYFMKRAEVFKFYIDNIRKDPDIKEAEKEKKAKIYEEKLKLLLEKGYPEGDKGTADETYAVCEKSVAGFSLCSRCLNYRAKYEFEHEDRHGITRCFGCREYLAGVANLSNPGNVSRRGLVELYISLKKGKKCIDCGNSEYKVLEFDHKNPAEKTKQVKEMTSIETMKSEAAKCDLRCSNCHQIRTMKQNIEKRGGKITPSFTGRGQQQAREFVDGVRKKIGKCEVCGYFNKDFLSVLQFDHLDPTTKNNTISQMVRDSYPLAEIEQEIKKCRMICANCHRLHTIKQYNYMSYSWMQDKY